MSLLLGFPEYREQARRLADAAGMAFHCVEIHHFPDGESRVRLPEKLPPHVTLCRSLHRPNEKLIELLLAATTARRLGARRVSLVAPYLCYMRQDKEFRPGEAISQRIIGELLAGMLDDLITVDPHLHRIRHLRQAVPVKCAITLSATGAMARWLSGRVEDPLLIGPDEESLQWVSAIARHEALDYCVAKKVRRGDRDVRVTLPEGSYGGRNIVLVDDVVSTGRTLEAAAAGLAPQRPASISVLVTHALFTEEAWSALRRAGVEQIWSCDTIPHPSNRIRLAELMGQAVRKISGAGNGAVSASRNSP
ncbi:MAG TPA: ribose-phosphate diphosphokinase [Gammaproteobacteria bacterium]|nr:ribose-phosphate diphosphokinase [Gammaproteobacteria bacterium]